MPRTDAPSAAGPSLQAPRFASAWAALAYVISAMTLAYPALTGAFAAAPRSDQYIAGYGFREFAAQSLKAGQGFPQWDAYLQGGMPYIAAMHGDIFYPTFLLRMLLPTDVAMTWGFIIHLILAGLLTYGFLRALGLGFYASLIGGLAYMMSGPIAAYVSPGHDGKLFVSSLLPLSMWMLLRWMRDGRLWAVGALALTIGLAVLSPHPQLLQYLLLASGSFALFLALTGPLPRLAAFKRLGAALGAVMLGGAIGAVQYLPVRGYVSWSPRGAGGSQTGWEHAVSYSMPIEELLNTFIPEFSGILDAYWGRNQIHFHSEYVGVVTLILAGAGMFAAMFPRNLRWFWIGTLIVSLLWTLGGNTPFYRIVYELVPGTKFFRAPSTMMYVCMFSVAVLAAFGAERILVSASSLSRRFILAWGGALLLLALVTLGSAVSIADTIAESLRSVGYENTDWMTEGVRANRGALLAGTGRALFFAAATLGLLWMYRAGKVPTRNLAWAIAALLVLDLWTVERKYWNFSRPARESFATDPAIEAIKAAGESGRVVFADFTRLLRSAVEPPVFRDPLYNGSASMVHHVRSLTGYHGNELGRYQQLVRQGSRYYLGDRQELWRHQNVHWMYTNLPDSILGPVTQQLGYSGTFTKVLGPVKNASGSTVYLYRVPGENPAAVVANAIVKGSDEQALATVLDPRFDARRAAIVDTSATIPTAQITAVPEPSAVQARTTRYDSGAINVELTAPVPSTGSMLIVSENFYPGWRASVGGQDVEVVRANYNLIGVPLPAGARQVALRFQDPSYATGKLVTLLAILASVALVAVGIVVERRRPVPAAA
jgi:hypothetical protein